MKGDWTTHRVWLRTYWEVSLDDDNPGWKVAGWARTPWGARRSTARELATIR